MASKRSKGGLGRELPPVMGQEHAPLLGSAQEHSHYTLYTRRWYILILFSLLSLYQSNLWITYGALAETTKELYNVSSSATNFLAATGPLGFIPFSSLTSWALGEYGIRVSCVIAAAMCAAGAVLRCFATHETYWIVIVAQLLNAFSGPVVMNTPPALSATWFGVEERTFATAVGTVANSVGSATAFLVGLLVHNTTQMKYLLYIEAIVAIVLLAMFVIYFPTAPPTPPSATSAMKKESLSAWKSMRETVRESAQVLRSRDGLFLLISGGVPSGAIGGWGAMLVLILAQYYSQWDIQWLGLFNILGSVTGGLIVGKIHDHYRHFKVLMIIFYGLATAIYVLFSLATQRTIVCSFAEIMVLNIAAGATLGALFPVSYEALAEVTYPVKEEVSAGFLSLMNNFACLGLLILGDYKTGNFINWMMAGISAFSLVLVLFTRERYLRTNIDLK